MVNATEMRPCFVIFQIALAIGFSLFTFPLKRLGLNGASLFTFLPLKILFTFKMTFCYFFRLFA